MWCIWRKRNGRSFEDCEITVVELKAFFFSSPYHWTAAIDCFHFYSFHDFVNICSFPG